ncbi:ubiquitin carboxy-terminal hydrolase (macronuclear) [Tetrahymena thermophila SB210]|uniref:ubiquitinyl hydrolase 1 n=1 Tax=Tetrahymena thermophila (strain SB210) TaxID=312017 RepID=I7MA10_TETTS|nr:ubiquitin carboxy-terminal hydrolase [Tetrahymena thermophila SB210]EAS03186.2 ubiquitin carboxy-terminal hydrolase [Tetrahymena thermophila SB210]|eukprot:XP_001023431.2 ubiquitin carboxy-terminal hydrolase [Tetrahymena thermophila SB210]
MSNDQFYFNFEVGVDEEVSEKYDQKSALQPLSQRIEKAPQDKQNENSNSHSQQVPKQDQQHLVENEQSKIVQDEKKQNTNYQIIEEQTTQTQRVIKAKPEIQQKMIYLRKATSLEEFESTIQELIKQREEIMLIYFLIENEIYNDQMHLMMFLKFTFEKKQQDIFNNILCQKEIVKYIQKCNDISKISDILYIAFQRNNRYDDSFFQQICSIIQSKIDNQKDKEQSDFFLTNFFRIMVKSKRYNQNSGQYLFPQKSKINVNIFLTKILVVIQYVIAYPLTCFPKGYNFSNIEVIKVIIDYIFLLKTEDIIQVHYIKYLFDLIQPHISNLSLDGKYKILQYVLECIIIKYDDKDPVKYPYSSSVLLSYFESIFLPDHESSETITFQIDKAFEDIYSLTSYEINNLMTNLFYSFPSEFTFLIMEQLADRLCQSNDQEVQNCLYQDIFQNLILKKATACIKKEGKIKHLCNMISTYLYIFQDKIKENSKWVFQVLKYNNFIFHSFSDLDQIYQQQRINHFCKLIRQIILHKQLTPDFQNKIEQAYKSVSSLVKKELDQKEFKRKCFEYENKVKKQESYIDGKQFSGFDNYGNTCYFNSFNQIILRLPIFNEYLNSKNKYIVTPLFENYRKLLKSLNSPNKYGDQILIKDIVQLSSPLFRWGTQQDPQEYFVNFVRQLYFDEKNITRKEEQDKQAIQHNLFTIEKFGRRTCHNCKLYSNYKKEQSPSIQINLGSQIDSTELDFFQLTKQTESQYQKAKLTCSTCNKNVEMSSDELYSRIPPILVFQLNRIKDYQCNKNLCKVKFPEFFNFLEIQNNGYNFPYNKSNYRLVGIVNHIGKYTNCGHYVCYLRYKQTNKWILFNDKQVDVFQNSLTLSQILQINSNDNTPYLLVYQNFTENEPVSKEQAILDYFDRFRQYDKYHQNQS